jgi:DNA topoisomerase-1
MGREHVEAARRAGLRYTPDSIRGLRREVDGEGFVFYGVNGHRIRNERKLRRILTLAIPPAWTDVWICPYPNGHLQVTARDARGRKQYRYHPKYRAIRDETKFDRMKDFSSVLPAARRAVEAHLSMPGLPREKVLATVVWLLERTLIRVGNIEYARENESYGLTTFEDRHVEIRGQKVTFTFTGKSGIEHCLSFADARLARIIQRCQTLPGEHLFQYIDDDGNRQDIDSGTVNEYLQEIAGLGITAKDFRTWAGTMLAARALCEIGPAELVGERKKNILTAIDRVADRLGNTRTVCRQYYIHPVVLEAYDRGQVVELPKARSPERNDGAPRLRSEEVAVLRFIDEQRA